MAKTKIIILGANGMLGSEVYKYLHLNKKFNVIGTTRLKRDKNFDFFDGKDFIKNPENYKFITKADYIINCIGIIKPFCKDDDNEGILNALLINSTFPYVLANFIEKAKSNTKIINIATDCVFSGEKGNYHEHDPHSPMDTYDKSKDLGEINSMNTLNIRTSIIGPQTNHSQNLMQWLLEQENGSKLNGFSDHLWNGVTTLQFAKLTEKIISRNKFVSLRKKNHVIHFVPNKAVSKYELLSIINKIYEKELIIKKIKSPNGKVNRTLRTKYKELTNLYGKSDLKKEIKLLYEFSKK
ncbi:MAG: NAD-dependent epimerase/dehydratase family protein [Bacteroidia bacterium]|nr:MAG: NAD-dependent epimerase/dehydratase family protein [Bacteroidia bacterium]